MESDLERHYCDMLDALDEKERYMSAFKIEPDGIYSRKSFSEERT